jgi:hypothetical protein
VRGVAPEVSGGGENLFGSVEAEVGDRLAPDLELDPEDGKSLLVGVTPNGEPPVGT